MASVKAKNAKAASAEAVSMKADGFITGSVATGTLKTYDKEWLKWRSFRLARKASLTLRPKTVEAYLRLEVASKRSVSVLETFMAAMNWQCARRGMASPFGDERIALVLRGMKAQFRRPVVPRLPFTRTHICKFLDLGRSSTRLWRAAVILSMCYSDFLRFSEVAFMRLEDTRVDRAGVHFQVKKAKNHRRGFDVLLPVEKRRYCVGAYVLEFIEKGLKRTPGSAGWLCGKVDGAAFFPDESVSYSSLHSGCKSLIKQAGLDPSLFSTHSAKRGSATAAVFLAHAYINIKTLSVKSFS
jgi:integrase